MMQLKWYRILKKLHLNSAALGFLRGFCGDTLSMTEKEAETVLESVYPRHFSTCLRETPRDGQQDGVMLSILVPTYNNSAYIEECLNSALTQKVSFRFEILVVNDGSTDDTAEKLKRFSADPRVRILNQKNAGVSAARNTAMDAAAGKYFLFLDGDDILLPDALEKLVSCAEREQAAIVEGGYRMMDMDGKIIRTYSHLSGQMDAARQLSGFVCFKVFRREVWERLQFPVKIYYEDSVMAQVIREQIARNGEKAVGIPEAVGGYRYNLKSFSNTFQARPLSVDTVWITENLLRDRQNLGLTATESYHDHLLEMAKLSWIRLEAMPVRVRQALFVLYGKWIRENSIPGENVPENLRNLNTAFEKGSFKLFQLCCCLED